jgi:predicted PurR-regulated permease PerM
MRTDFPRRQRSRGRCCYPAILRGYFLAVCSSSQPLPPPIFASEIVLPLVLAFIPKLLLQPAVRALEQVYVTRTLASLPQIVVIFETIVGLTVALSMPASAWAAKLPQGVSWLEERLSFLRSPIDTLQRFLEPDRFREGGPLTSAQSGTDAYTLAKGILTRVFAGTQVFATGGVLTLLFLFFLLAHGDIFLRRVVEILPRFG